MGSSDQSPRTVERLSVLSSLARWRLASFVFLALIFVMSPYLDIDGFVEGTSGGGKFIARIFISGTITEDHERDQLLMKIRDDANISALIVHIDSPGGTVVGAETLYTHLLGISCKKHVVSVMGTIAASGGYMAALAADHIIAHHGTITGSIGVLSTTFDVVELMDKVGIRATEIKSGPLKAASSPFEKMSEKGKENLQHMIYDSYEFFISLVQKHRNLSFAEAKERGDGRLYTGSQAVRESLIDQIGGEQEALEWLESKKIKLPVRTIKLSKDINPVEKVLKGLSSAFASISNFLSIMQGTGNEIRLLAQSGQ